MVKRSVKKSAKKADKLLTGLIVGGAIGSVVGLALAPKSGKENREVVIKEAEKAYQKTSSWWHKPKPTTTETPPLPKKKSFLGRIFKLISGK